MDREVRYLKINPETYQLSPKQFWKIDECQFCGNDTLFWRKSFNERKGYKAISWICQCSSCKKTVAYVRRDLDF